MDAANHKVLFFGHDVARMREREAQLRAAGFNVDSTSRLDEAISLAQNQRYQLGIVGHRVGEADRNRLAMVLRSSGCRIPIIFLYQASIHNAGLADAVLSMAADGQDLISAVNSLISAASAASCADLGA
jgi:DNA-binding response OmpR family regulator